MTKNKYLVALLLVVCILVFCIIYCDIKHIETRLTLIVLIITSLIYAGQLNVMNKQKKISKASYDNQEKILKEQKDIAKQQYDFNVFQMRMNLRNKLYIAFTQSLSVTGLDITDNVNDRLTNIARPLYDIQFAFPVDAELEKLIEKFKSCCKSITELAMEKK